MSIAAKNISFNQAGLTVYRQHLSVSIIISLLVFVKSFFSHSNSIVPGGFPVQS